MLSPFVITVSTLQFCKENEKEIVEWLITSQLLRIGCSYFHIFLTNFYEPIVQE